MDRLTTRRDYCVKEMVETEQNYVKALGMICEVSTEEIVVWGVGGDLQTLLNLNGFD